MFWTNVYTLSPHIEALLKKEDVTLQELMDQEEVVPECRSHNKLLVDFLSRRDVMEELVTLTIKEPSIDIDERNRYKYPNIACELLTCNVPSMNEKLAGDESLLATLYSFIDTDEPLNPLLASFFSKTIGVLLTRKGDQNWYSYQFMCLQVLEFLKSREKCVDRLLQHLETSAIMDLILKLVTKVEGPDMRQNVLNWLSSQQLVQQLIKLLSSTSTVARHANASQLLCDMIRLTRYFRSTLHNELDPILATLESDETTSLLLETILSDEPMESSIVGGIQVLLVLLGHEPNNAGNEGDGPDNKGDDVPDDVGRLIIQNATLPYLEQLHKLLLNPPPKPPVKTTAGLLTSPLGNTRLHIAKLLVALLHVENIKLFKKLAQLGTFQTLFDLFFKYSWNNFLHTQVEQCLASVINGEWLEKTETVYSHIFVECKLINRLLDAWDQNQNKEIVSENRIRAGYMGHLINIANNIVKECKKNPTLAEYLKTNPSVETAEHWEQIVNTELADIITTQELELGGKPQLNNSGSDDLNDEYSAYGQDAYVQQSYANYQSQQMTPNFIDHCGYHDDEFNDCDAALQHCMLSNSVDQLMTMPFNVNEEDLDKGEDMFNKICQQKQKAGLDENAGAVEWGDEGELTFQTVIDKRDWPSKQQHQDSNSSDEDEDTREINMEADSTDPWGSTEPWDLPMTETSEYTGWANFDNFDKTLTITDALKISESLPTNQEMNVDRTSEPFVAPPEAPVSVANTNTTIKFVSDSNMNIETAEKLFNVDKQAAEPEKLDTPTVEMVTIHEQSRKAEISEMPACVTSESASSPPKAAKSLEEKPVENAQADVTVNVLKVEQVDKIAPKAETAVEKTAAEIIAEKSTSITEIEEKLAKVKIEERTSTIVEDSNKAASTEPKISAETKKPEVSTETPKTQEKPQTML